jgi:hypothetical protein
VLAKVSRPNVSANAGVFVPKHCPLTNHHAIGAAQVEDCEHLARLRLNLRQVSARLLLSAASTYVSASIIQMLEI